MISNGSKKIRGPVIPTNGWYEYKSEEAGVLEIKEAGGATIRLFPEKELKHFMMYFSHLEFILKE